MRVLLLLALLHGVAAGKKPDERVVRARSISVVRVMERTNDLATIEIEEVLRGLRGRHTVVWKRAPKVGSTWIVVLEANGGKLEVPDWGRWEYSEARKHAILEQAPPAEQATQDLQWKQDMYGAAVALQQVTKKEREVEEKDAAAELLAKRTRSYTKRADVVFRATDGETREAGGITIVEFTTVEELKGKHKKRPLHLVTADQRVSWLLYAGDEAVFFTKIKGDHLELVDDDAILRPAR